MGGRGRGGIETAYRTELRGKARLHPAPKKAVGLKTIAVSQPDGPAVKKMFSSSGYYEYRDAETNERHRTDGPAVHIPDIKFAGEKISSDSYYENGKLHRLDGPAIEFSDGAGVWAIEGEIFSTEDAWKRAKSGLAG